MDAAVANASCPFVVAAIATKGRAPMAKLVEHIERHLGLIQEGWAERADGVRLPFQVVRTQGGPLPDSCIYLTLGMSNSPLRSPRSEKLIRQELLMVVHSTAGHLGVPSVLQQVASEFLSRGRPALRGEVIGPRDAVFPGSKLESLYVAIPVYFPDSFHSCDVEGLGTVVFCWLVPIAPEEAQFVREFGWARFEAALAEKDPDLADVFRPPMSIHS
jgi:hypothetical protein